LRIYFYFPDVLFRLQFEAWYGRHKKPIRTSASKPPDDGTPMSPTSPTTYSRNHLDALDSIDAAVAGTTGRGRSASTSEGPEDKMGKKPVKSAVALGFTEEERDQMEELLREIRGHLGTL
jgi:hypothetical protein